MKCCGLREWKRERESGKESEKENGRGGKEKEKVWEGVRL